MFLRRATDSLCRASKGIFVQDQHLLCRGIRDAAKNLNGTCTSAKRTFHQCNIQSFTGGLLQVTNNHFIQNGLSIPKSQKRWFAGNFPTLCKI
jgi:hypothetical protein